MIFVLALLLALFLVPSPWNIVVIFLGAVAEVGEVIWGRRIARRWRPRTGAEAMIGTSAKVVTPLRPNGQVRLNGELWEATCAVGADAGATVIVKRLEALTLIVDPAPVPNADPIRTT